MAFQKDTIRLGAAQRIFPQFDIKEQVTASGSPTGIYSATLCDTNGGIEQIVEKGLTHLCIFLVEKIAARAKLNQLPDAISAESGSIPGLGPK
ncbi:MAG: hypothetical protein AAGF93_00500 [Cyanobacteria bacterium P01_H01_bin.105]